MSTDGPPAPSSALTAAIEELLLVDHHVHGACVDDLARSEFEEMITESDRPIPSWMTQFDSQVGFAIRRWCAPILDLPPSAPADEYFERRMELGGVEVSKRLLTNSGIDSYIVETGYKGDLIVDPAGMTSMSGRPSHEVVRIEAIMESVLQTQVSPQEFPQRFVEELHRRARNAVGLKSIVAYRYGFDFDPQRPSQAEVIAAVDEHLRSGASRVSDITLLRYGLWAGVDLAMPLQLHTGYGDPDLDLHRCDPLLLTRWLKSIESSGTDILLLHCYPFQRNAGYLAQVFPHVYLDVGLAINYVGSRSEEVIAESMELAPFSKILFSSDAWGPAELHYLGAKLWRRGTARLLDRWVADGEWTEDDAVRVARMIASENAVRVYRLGGGA